MRRSGREHGRGQPPAAGGRLAEQSFECHPVNRTDHRRCRFTTKLPVMPDKHALAVITLVSWLLAESLGAYMLTSWISSGGHQAPADLAGAVPRWVIFGHAGLAFTGLLAWISFV